MDDDDDWEERLKRQQEEQQEPRDRQEDEGLFERMPMLLPSTYEPTYLSTASAGHRQRNAAIIIGSPRGLQANCAPLPPTDCVLDPDQRQLTGGEDQTWGEH